MKRTLIVFPYLYESEDGVPKPSKKEILGYVTCEIDAIDRELFSIDANHAMCDVRCAT